MAENEAEQANQAAEEAKKRHQINQATLKDAKGLENRLGQYLWINLTTSKNHQLDPVAVKQGVLSVCGDQAKKIFKAYLSETELEELLKIFEGPKLSRFSKISKLGKKLASTMRGEFKSSDKLLVDKEDDSYEQIRQFSLNARDRFIEVFQNPNDYILVQTLVNRVLKDRLVEISGLDEAGKIELSQKLDSIPKLWALEQANLSNEVKAKYLSSPGKHWTKAQNAQEAFNRILCDLITLSTQEQLEELSLNQPNISNASLKFRLIEKTGLSDAEQEKLAAKLDQIKYLWSLDKDNYCNSSKMEYLKNSMRYDPLPQNAQEAFDRILHDLITLSTHKQVEYFASTYAHAGINIDKKTSEAIILHDVMEQLKEQKISIPEDEKEKIEQALRPVLKEFDLEYLKKERVEITKEIADDLYKNRDIAKHIVTNRHELTISDKILDKLADKLDDKYRTHFKPELAKPLVSSETPPQILVYDTGVRKKVDSISGHSKKQRSSEQEAELTIPPMIATAAELQGAISQLHHNQDAVHHNQATTTSKEQDSKASSDSRHNPVDLGDMRLKPPPLPPKHHAPKHSTANFPDPKDKPAKPPRKYADRVRPQPQQQSDGPQSKISQDFLPQGQKPPKPPRHKLSDKVTPPPLPPKKSHTERVHNPSRSSSSNGVER